MNNNKNSKQLEEALNNNNHDNNSIDNTDNANELFYSEYEFEEDGSIFCDGHWEFVPVLKHLMEKGCPPAHNVRISAGSTEITLHVCWAWTPVHEDVAVIVLYCGQPLRFWRDIQLRDDLKKDDYEKFKKYESRIDFEEFGKFVDTLQEWTVFAREFYYYHKDWQRENDELEIWEHFKDESADKL